MRSPSRRALRFAVLVAVLAATVGLVADAGCGPDQTEIWLCLNPVNGKEDSTVHDDSHYVNGVFDPCHCYDPCGPLPSCPSVIDAGPLPPGCDAGTDAGTGGTGGGDGGH